jgi:hypothetical protein
MLNRSSLTLLVTFVASCLVLASVGEVRLAAACAATFLVVAPVVYVVVRRSTKRGSNTRAKTVDEGRSE